MPPDPPSVACFASVCVIIYENLPTHLKFSSSAPVMYIEELAKEMSLKIDISWNEIDISNKSTIAIKTISSDANDTQMVKNMADIEYRLTLLSSCLVEDKSIKRLCLSKFGMTIAGANELAKSIQRNTILQSIDISGNCLGDEGMPAISGMLIDTLEEINISKNEISCEGAKILAEKLESNKTLKVLRISENSLRDEGVMAILTSSDCLEKLDVSNTDLTETGGQMISKAIQFNKKMIHLDVFHAGLANKSGFHAPIFNALKYNQTLEVLNLPWLDGDDPLKQKLIEINQNRQENKVHSIKCECFRL